MKKVIAVIVIILVAAGWYSYGKKEAAAEKSSTPKTVKVEKRTLVNKVTASGSVMPLSDVEIKSKSSGEVTKLPFDISDYVEKGQLIAELDPTDEMQNVAKKKIDLMTSQASLEKSKNSLRIFEIQMKSLKKSADSKYASNKIACDNAQKKYERQMELYKKKLVSEESVENAEADLEKAKNTLLQSEIEIANLATVEYEYNSKAADVKLSEAKLKTTEIEMADYERRLAETKIFSPVSGYISERAVQLGQIVASGISNVNGGTKMFVVSDLSSLYIETAIDESDISKLSVGNNASISVEAYPNRTFRGKVTRIAIKGEVSNNIVSFTVKIEVDDPESNLLKPGMTANVDIITQRKRDAIVIPLAALYEDEKGTFVKTPSNPRLPITTGMKTFDMCEITEGLKEGDEVLSDSTLKSQWSNSRNKDRSVRMMMGGGRGK